MRTGSRSNNRQRRKEIRATNRTRVERSYDDIAAVRKQSFTFSLSLEPIAERPSVRRSNLFIPSRCLVAWLIRTLRSLEPLAGRLQIIGVNLAGTGIRRAVL